jgi:hypothetical protein
VRHLSAQPAGSSGRYFSTESRTRSSLRYLSEIWRLLGRHPREYDADSITYQLCGTAGALRTGALQRFLRGRAGPPDELLQTRVHCRERGQGRERAARESTRIDRGAGSPLLPHCDRDTDRDDPGPSTKAIIGLYVSALGGASGVILLAVMSTLGLAGRRGPEGSSCIPDSSFSPAGTATLHSTLRVVRSRT